MLNLSYEPMFYPGAKLYSAPVEASRSSGHSIDPVARERQRIARDLHDNAGQYLVGIALRLKVLELSSRDLAVRDSITHIRGMLSRFGEELRATCDGNRGGIPKASSLVSAVESLVSEWQRDTGISVFFEYEIKEGAEIDDDEAEAVFRIVQESLTNVAKHAASASRVDVRLRVTRSRIRLEVADSSIKKETLSDACCCIPNGGKGISGMRDRVSELGGQLWVRHTPGKGAQLVAII
jgi:signal transduction histidine kinase